MRAGQDGLEAIMNATPGVVAEVRLRQVRSYYWSEFPAEGSSDTVAGAELMRFKYGAQTPAEISSLCRACGAASPFELDLMFQHEAQVVGRHAFASLTSSGLDELASKQEPGLRLLILRYQNLSRKSGQAGHRVAFVVELVDKIRFFDPNCGEVVFQSVSDLGDWLLDAWQVCGYAGYAATPVSGVPAIRVFQFGSAIWQPGREERAGQDSHDDQLPDPDRPMIYSPRSASTG